MPSRVSGPFVSVSLANFWARRDARRDKVRKFVFMRDGQWWVTER